MLRQLQADDSFAPEEYADRQDGLATGVPWAFLATSDKIGVEVHWLGM